MGLRRLSLVTSSVRNIDVVSRAAPAAAAAHRVLEHRF